MKDSRKRTQFLDWCNGVYREGLVDVFVHYPARHRGDLPPAEKARLSLLKKPPEPEERVKWFDAHQEDILAWFNQRARGSAEPDAPIQTVIEARDVLQEHRHAIQSQAMGGFNEALLMQQQVLHFDPVDPLGFAEYRKFSEIIVRAAVKGHAHTAPLPHFEHFDFHPIRTGEMRLQRVRLVDSFGRPANLPATLHTTQQLYSERDGHVSLPPRITQPARVNFRWLSAGDDAQDCNPHPVTSPICGWLVPNNLDRSLMIYDGAGALLGYVDGDGRWRSVPGRPGPALAADIGNPHLSKMVLWLEKRGREHASFIDDFVDVLDSALENIDPEGFEQHEARALLMGRPLALVRASVGIELLGLPALDQSWDALNQALAGDEFDMDGFLGVRFPIRIGEHEQLNDGVAGYWIDSAEGDRENRFYAPQSEWTARDSVPKPLGFIAFAPEWLGSGAADRPPAIPAPGSALGSHPCVATILRPGEARIAGMHGLGQLKSKTSCRGGLRRGTTTTCPGRGPMAGFEVTLYGRICGDHRGQS